MKYHINNIRNIVMYTIDRRLGLAIYIKLQINKSKVKNRIFKMIKNNE